MEPHRVFQNKIFVVVCHLISWHKPVKLKTVELKKHEPTVKVRVVRWYMSTETATLHDQSWNSRKNERKTVQFQYNVKNLLLFVKFEFVKDIKIQKSILIYEKFGFLNRQDHLFSTEFCLVALSIALRGTVRAYDIIFEKCTQYLSMKCKFGCCLSQQELHSNKEI